MTARRLRSSRAFTLADLLVSTTVVVVLIPILLPALNSTGERARVEKCLSNLRQLMTATDMYLSEYDDRFPLYIPALHGNGISGWAYGGKTNHDYWLDGPFHTEARDRPVNPYILGTRVQPDLRDGDEIVKRTEVPPLLCPSDSITHQRMFNDPAVGGPSPIASYDDVGTSYHFNRHALSDVDYCGDTNPWGAPGTWADISHALIRDVKRSHSSTFTMFFEDPMDWGIWDQIMGQTYGSHGEFSKHSCGYLDGHADYLYRDTRTHCGVGWEAIDPNWVRQRGQPTPHPVYYPRLAKNCDPPIED